MRVHQRIVLAIVAVLGIAACRPATLEVVADVQPVAAATTDPAALTPAQVQWLEGVAEADRQAAAFLEHVAAVRAAVPGQLRTIRWCEAGRYIGLPHPETNYQARTHGEDGASGGYQMVGSTWTTWAAEVGVDTTAWPRAYRAPDFVQDLVATHGYATRGTAPWNASSSCWAPRT